MPFKFVRGFTSIHDGIDLSADRGTPIHAVAGGRVVFAGWGGSVITQAPPGAPAIAAGGGNVVHVDVGGGTIEQYAHLDSIAVATGSSVSAGTVLGGVGATGNAFGYHLHFGVWRGGWIDPAGVMSVSALIAAVTGAPSTGAYGGGSGAGGGGSGGGVNPDPEADHRVALFRAALRSIGISTDPNHRITDGEALLIVAYLYKLKPGPDAEHLAGTLAGFTVADLEAQVRTGLSLGTDAISRLARGIGDVPAALGGILARAGQVTILVAIVLLGLYLLAADE